MSGGRRIFITGGARSGKSSHALALAGELAPPGAERLFIATMRPYDEECGERIERHRMDRAGGWITIEEPLDIGAAIQGAAGEEGCVLVDCLTLWLGNLMMDGLDPAPRIEGLLRTMEGLGGQGALVMVSNEVGMGIVPENALARRFRDLSGWMNQQVARACDEVYLMASGLPLRLK